MLTVSTLIDPGFSPHSLNKYASLLTTGNGYMGVRGTHEEDYTQQTRGMYLAGLYHCAGRGETNELVNLPDVTGVQLEVNGEPFTLLSGQFEHWLRELDFSCGELRREVIWRAPSGARVRIVSRRFTSMAQHPLLAMQFTVTALDRDVTLSFSSGIDGTQTNSGRQHLDELSLRVFGQQVLQGAWATQSGSHEVVITSHCQLSQPADSCFTAKNRRLMQNSVINLTVGDSVTLEKVSWVVQRQPDTLSLDTFSRRCLNDLQASAAQGYEALRAASQVVWQQEWVKCRVVVDSRDARDQLALDFAHYHLAAMTPAHDERTSIAAKALTGEGYKGHVFWDTEVFLLPYHLLTNPETARSLLRYRYLNLAGAREKARRNGWHGALFPWESAQSGQEETPEFAAINIRTGLRQKVASALAEHHLVADIAWAVVNYWYATQDEAFMREEGITLLTETATFWISRATEVNGRLEIHDVIGPDEYTEHVNNNAFTNYLAWHNVEKALHFARQFGDVKPAFAQSAADFLQRLWLPKPDEHGVLAQDDTFFSKPTLDLSKYKAKAGKQTILLDYSRAEVNEMQILKQADVVMLTYMLPERFSAEECLANLAYYEPRTIHDSSLSKAIHGIVAARCGQPEEAYRFWQAGCEIDLGEDPHSSDDGIHAAATGAIWLGAVQGFAGLSVCDGELHLSPTLPEAWRSLRVPLCWHGVRLVLDITADDIVLTTTQALSLWLWGRKVCIEGEARYARSDFLNGKFGTATSEGIA
ncbi:glycoside hydrolase family 65 protein [Scandinavium sp. NPDC088450]|uniref:glycoside hydrolase family 65 protein n=1 Tax=Scandinavium sp. NPDC088450 TaxID=3364514 RepID=UPI0038505E8B